MNKPAVFWVVCVLVAAAAGWSRPGGVCAADGNAGGVLADDRGTLLYARNPDTLFVPASILKILTSLTALHVLGETHHFPTLYAVDDRTQNLYLKGFGDPLFTSEIIEQLCREIILKFNPARIQDIVLDHSYYSGAIRVPGKGDSLNPYDASVGAICANFNTIVFQWNPETRAFVSGEPQTPLLSIFREDIEKTRLKRGRIVLSRQKSQVYPGFLIKHFLEKNSVKVIGSVATGTLPPDLTNQAIFLSPHDLRAIVRNLLTYSNNFIANQLLLAVGAKVYGEPASLEKGVRAIQVFAARQMQLDRIALSEGSGLSRLNKLSPRMMIRVLMEFMPYHDLLNRDGEDLFKTGTLTGVRTRAGYIRGRNNRLYPYAIMVNQAGQEVTPVLKHLKALVGQMN